MPIRYVIAIEPGDEKTAFGIVVPDLDGCFSAGDTLEEAMTNAEEAIHAWIDAALDKGLAIPKPSGLSAIQQDPDYAGWVFAVVTIDPAILDDTIERVNISLPRRVLARLDALAAEAHETRSGYIARRVATEPA